MDIQKIISEVVGKLKADPSLLKSFAADPVKTLEKTLGIDLPDDKINAVIEGVKGQVDLGSAGGILSKLKSLFFKK